MIIEPGKGWFRMNGVSDHTGFIDWELRGHATAEITNMTIKKNYRRKGHGSRLLVQAMESMEKCRVRYVYLFTESHNIDAHRFYEANGFERVAVVERFYQGHDAVLYGMVV